LSTARQVRQPAWLLWATLPAILLVVAFGLWLHLESRGPTSVDEAWLNFVGLDQKTLTYDVAVVLAEVGSGKGAVACTGLLAVIFALRRRIRTAAFLASAMGTGIFMSELLKTVVTRLRPVEQLYESTGFSYPSGHSMGAAALAASLAIVAARSHMVRRLQAAEVSRTTAAQSSGPLPSRRSLRRNPTKLRFHWSMLVAAAWILTMMWSRTALQVHWLSDTVAGALIGISAAVLVDEFFSLAAHRRSRLSPPAATPR
jgi:membrane-associated phospholipid phosphatase